MASKVTPRFAIMAAFDAIADGDVDLEGPAADCVLRYLDVHGFEIVRKKPRKAAPPFSSRKRDKGRR